jgi:hypothetical protein
LILSIRQFLPFAVNQDAKKNKEKKARYFRPAEKRIKTDAVCRGSASTRAFSCWRARCAGRKTCLASIIGGRCIALGDGLRHAGCIQPQLGSFHPANFIPQSGSFLKFQIGGGVLH